MKILVVTRDFPPRTNGGISTAVGYEVAGLVAAGHHCTVISFDNWRPVTDADECDRTVHIDGSSNPATIRLSSPAALDAARLAAAGSGPEVIHLHHSTLLDFALEVSGGRIPVIKTIHVLQHHMNWYRGVEQTISNDLQRRAIAECWQLVVMSNAAREMLLSEYPQFESKVTVVPPGIPDCPSAAGATWPRPGRVVSCAGRFSDIKGTERLFDIARGLVARDPLASVVIAGGLPDSPASERRFMRKWERGTCVEKTGIRGAGAPRRNRRAAPVSFAGDTPSRVTFPGWLDKSALENLFRSTSVYISPSVFETFGLAVAEAMLHSVPVVATRCGGPEEIVIDGETGILAPSGDTDAFVRLTVELLDNPDRCAAMGAAARESILARFSPAGHTERLTAIYRDAIS